MKKHHCKACNKKYCGKCSSIESLSTLMLDSNISKLENEETSKLTSSPRPSSKLVNRFRLCNECFEIFTVADDIYTLVKQRKQQLFEKYNNVKVCEDETNENINKSSTSQLSAEFTTTHIHNNNLLKPAKSQKILTESRNNNNNNNIGNEENIENFYNNSNSNENTKSETDPEYWYHLSPTERDQMRRKLYIPPSCDDKNAFYFVGNQRIVRRAKPSLL